MCFIRCKHRTRKEDAETAKGNSEILSMMMKYIMSMSSKDCKCQQEKRKPSGNVFILVVFSFCTHIHHQCIAGREIYVRWRNTKVLASKVITGKICLQLYPSKIVPRNHLEIRKKERGQQSFLACL